MRDTANFEQLRKEALARFKGHNEPGKTIVLFCHHEKFAEVLSEPIENRIDYIINEKPEGEIETRLRWIQPYKGHQKMDKAYAEWQKACAEWEKAYAEWEKADAEWEKVDGEWDKAYAEWKKADAERDKAYAEWEKVYEPIFMAEHSDCPWDGKTLFPKGLRP